MNHIISASDQSIAVRRLGSASGSIYFSCGVESAIQVGLVHDVVSLKAFVETSLVRAAQCDAIGPPMLTGHYLMAT